MALPVRTWVGHHLQRPLRSKPSPLGKKPQSAGLCRKRIVLLPTERAGKAMPAVSGRDTANTWPEPASKKATTSLGRHGFARPLGGVRLLCRLRQKPANWSLTLLPLVFISRFRYTISILQEKPGPASGIADRPDTR